MARINHLPSPSKCMRFLPMYKVIVEVFCRVIAYKGTVQSLIKKTKKILILNNDFLGLED